jgi:hypothetical protein
MCVFPQPLRHQIMAADLGLASNTSFALRGSRVIAPRLQPLQHRLTSATVFAWPNIMVADL